MDPAVRNLERPRECGSPVCSDELWTPVRDDGSDRGVWGWQVLLWAVVGCCGLRVAQECVKKCVVPRECSGLGGAAPKHWPGLPLDAPAETPQTPATRTLRRCNDAAKMPQKRCNPPGETVTQAGPADVLLAGLLDCEGWLARGPPNVGIFFVTEPV